MAEDKQKYAQQIGRFIPINELPQHALTEVIKRAELLKIRKGGTVFKQGDRDEFSYYVVEGEIELHANNQLHNTIVGGTDRASYAMAQLQPRQFAAKASKPSTVMKIRRDYLDKLLVIHEKEGPENKTTVYDLATAEVEVSEVQADDEVDWMTRMLQSELFSRMPTANIHALFALLEPVEFNAGDIVIKQGDPGQHYFIIQEGHCQVLRAPPSGGNPIKLADLRAGDSFGEEALITDTTRNATVAMMSKGILMQLSKDNFIELIKKPTLHVVNYDQAMAMVLEGAQWLDVRFKNEHEQTVIEGSINIPINVLRMQVEKLDPQKPYIAYCDTGGRSSTAAFLLAQRGHKVSYLQGGLNNNSGAARAVEAAPEIAIPQPTPKPQAAKPQPSPPPKPAAASPPPPPKPASKPAAAPPPPPPPPPKKEAAPAKSVEESREELDPDVKASVLETELARTNLQLKEMEKQREAMKDMAQKDAQVEVERRLREERAKMEVAKKQAEEESKRLREIEEEKLHRMKANAELRMQEERKKLEEVYSRNAEEMEKLQRMKQEAEESMQKERERLERESEQARKQLEEANAIKKQVEASRRAMEKEAEKQRKEQEAMEKKAQAKAREKLEEERKKMAEHFARNNEELERAKQERAVAEAGRQAAKEEAARIIEEFKSKSEEARIAEAAKLQAERQKLEEEQRKIRQTMLDIEKARRDAETARHAATEEVERLLARQQDDEITRSDHARESLQKEIRVAEEKLSEASRSVSEADNAHEKADYERQVNEEDIELRKQLASELQGFKKTLDDEEKKFVNIKSQMDHMKRIRQKADEAKVKTQQATDNLLSDVASQLGGG